MRCGIWAALIFHSCYGLSFSGDRPNVLFIAVDDLRVELNCYGQKHVISPNIDRLAQEGTLFERAYCQQTVCNPSRASVLTGLRPDTLKVWDLPTHFRTHHPGAVTLPQLLRSSGYFTQCIGKIFHNWRQDEWKGDSESWSVPAILHYNSHGRDQAVVAGETPPNLASGRGGLECRDVSDNAYFDGRVAEAAVKALSDVAENSKPWFLAVGFWKPHTPFNAPKKYWDLYDRSQIPIPASLTPPVDMPNIALTSARYDSNSTEAELWELHHGHLAAISYLDEQVGKVLAALTDLELTEKTIVVFWSDHGLHLGEHGLTRKTTVFELDAAVPVVIRTPAERRAQRCRSLVELIDLYPTIAELCGLSVPGDVEGKSLVPLLRNSSASVRESALTQTPRPNYLRGKKPREMGYSIRTSRFRYTEWRNFSNGRVLARELYDHRNDPGETVNVVKRSQYRDTIPDLSEQLNRRISGGDEN